MRRRAENRGADSRAARKVETGKRVKGSGLVLPTFAEGRKYLLLTTSAVLVLKEVWLSLRALLHMTELFMTQLSSPMLLWQRCFLQ